MKKIDKIIFKNFKAFNGEQEIDFNSKNLLLYGENGSGKSSIFWGIYTFLQSTTKKQDKIKDYFVQFDEANPLTFSSLKNIYATAADEAFVELHTKDEIIRNTTVDYIKYTDSTTDIDKNNLLISMANAASDFINYKFLHNFYNVTHKQEINLWKVFEHDIFPFYRRTETDKYYQEEILSLTKGVPRSLRTGRKRSGGPRTQYEEKITNLNGRIDLFLEEIQNNANSFLKEYFFDNNDKIELNLTFKDKLAYNKIDNNRHDYSIILSLKFFDEINNRWISIKRPQSFLNEAQLTRIAIAIRIGALQTRVTTSDYKILCLDDMLISLDMGNREKVIKTFLNTDKLPALNYFDEFQKVIFTHDKAFYNLCKQRIKLSLDESQWLFKEIYLDTSKVPQRPYIEKNSDYFERAEKHLKAFDYPACANALRQGFENIIFNFLPDNSKLTIDRSTKTTTGKQFNDLLTELKNIHTANSVSTDIITDLFVYKDHILNPFSHDNIDTPAYREELEKLLELVPKVKILHTVTLKEIKDANSIIKFIDTDSTGELTTYEIFLKEHLKQFTLLDGNKYLNKCEVIVLKKISSDGTVTPLGNQYKNLKKCITRLSSFLGKTYANDDEIISKLDLN